MWDIDFFETDNGKCPTEEFLSKLSKKKELPYVDNALKQLEEHGYKLDRPKAALLEDGIYELRVKTIYGHTRLLYFFFDGNKIIVTHGFRKKDDKVDPKEITRAKDYRRIYYERKGAKR
jgi:phage-related protein